MPQGKGTYGSQVGRPSKKKKYEGGGSIDPFSTKNPDSVVTKQALEEIKDQSNIPTSDAMERSQSSPMGNEVGTGTYKEGGKVKKVAEKALKGKGKDITDVIKAVEKKRKKKKAKEADLKEWTPFGPQWKKEIG